MATATAKKGQKGGGSKKSSKASKGGTGKGPAPAKNGAPATSAPRKTAPAAARAPLAQQSLATRTAVSGSSNGQANGHVTKADEYRRKLSAELSDAYRTLGRANARHESLKAQAKSAKGDVESAQQDVNDLVQDLRDVELGQYQPDLFDRPAASNGRSQPPATSDATDPAIDEGAALPIEKLTEFGLPEGDLKHIANCPCHPKTIGEFEAWVRSDELWHTKIKGMGETKVEKLREAWTEFRLTYPMPDPDGIPAEAEMEADGDGAGGAGATDGEPAATPSPEPAAEPEAPTLVSE